MQVSTNRWLIAPPCPSVHKGNLVVYTSCHTWSMIPYLQLGRPDIADKFNLYGVVIHLAKDQQAKQDPRFAEVFANADVILHHPLEAERWEGLRVRDFKLKPGCRLITMESPQASCIWPVLSGLGEYSTVRMLEAGASPENIVAAFDAGRLDPDFAARYARDVVRLHQREAGVDLKSADFVFEHWKDVKMFSTCNHPTFHVYVWMLDQLAGLLGFPRRGVEEALRVKDFAIEGDGHYPETDYEFGYYQFRYPQKYRNGMGGPGFYHREIRTIHERWKAGLIVETSLPPKTSLIPS